MILISRKIIGTHATDATHNRVIDKKAGLLYISIKAGGIAKYMGPTISCEKRFRLHEKTGTSALSALHNLYACISASLPFRMHCIFGVLSCSCHLMKSDDI